MTSKRWSFTCLAGWAIAISTLHGQIANQSPMEPVHASGQGVTPAFEGWYANADGSSTILLGYYNRNSEQAFDIPVGPNNRIEPGAADQGQPTHFITGRQWGVFTITVPKGFPADKKITWTIVANGKSASIPVSLNPLYVVSPFSDATSNAPPFVAFDEKGPFLQGPPRALGTSLTATVNQPLSLPVWVADDAKIPVALERFAKMLPAVTLTWTVFRGAGAVVFANPKPKVEKTAFTAPPKTTYTGRGATTATFSQPGDYILEVTANDLSGVGGGGFQCCWTTTQVKVTVQ